MLVGTWVGEDKQGRKIIHLCPTCGGQVFTCPDPVCEEQGENAHHVDKPTACKDFSTANMVDRVLAPEEVIEYERQKKSWREFKLFMEKWFFENAAELDKLEYVSDGLRPDDRKARLMLARNRVESAMRDAWEASRGLA